MLTVELDTVAGIAILQPNGALSKQDFIDAANVIDQYLEGQKALKGIIIHVQSLPGWDSFASLVAHLKFIREHHNKVLRVAIATDSPIGVFAEKIADHFIAAEIKHFTFNELNSCKEWLQDHDK